MQTAQINISVNAQGANKSVEDLSNKISKAGGSAQSLRLELRKVTQELQQLEPGSARFVELSQRAGQLRDQIQDTNAVINATSGNIVENLGTALGNTIQLGVAGFQALSSAQVLFGVENKDLQKTLAQMGALLNLSQAIQTFGGLSDKLTEIKAGFTPFLQQLGLMATTQTEVAVATGVADAALVGESVAADGAAVSTGAFAAALNALPLVAIVTALGLLVAGLINYASSSSEASKAEEQRAKTLKAQRVEEEKARQTIAEESAEYIGLIYQLKATNKGSEEREKLIKKINSTYNTTLKNLSSETAFQKQLNLEVANYIAYQRAKYQLQKNEEKIIENFKNQERIQKKINDLTRKQLFYQSEVDRLNKSPDPLGIEQMRDKVNEFQKAIDKEKDALAAAQKRLELYGKVALDVNGVISDIEGTTGKYNTTLNNNSNATSNNIDKLNDYESILRSIQSVVDENQKLEDEIYKKRAENFDKTINLVEVEQQTKEDAAIKQYEAIKTAIEKELTKEKIKKEEKQKLNDAIVENEKALNTRLKLLGEERSLQIQIETAKRLEIEQKRYKYLVDEEKALQNEIRFGDGNTTDTKISLLNRQTQAYIQNITNQLTQSKYSNQIELDEFEKLQQERLTLLNQYATKEAEEKKSIAESEFNKILDQEKIRLEELKDLRVEYIKNENGEIISSRIKIIDEEKQKLIEMTSEERKLKLESLKKELDDAIKNGDQKIINEKQANYQVFNQQLILADELATNRELSEKNLNQEIVNLNEEKNTKILEADTELNTKIKDQTIKTEEEILDEKIKRADKYIQFVQEQFQQASSLISQFAKQQQEIRTTQLEDAISMDKERIDSQLAANLISREQYDNAIQQLDQKQQQEKLQIDRKNFRTEKALSLVGATIDGARAVLSAFAGTQGGIVIKSVAAALAGVFAATQIALIARQEFKAADGGIVPGNGSGQIDSVPSRLAPGEAVINSRSTQAFLPLLSAINEANGGKSFVPDLPPTNQPQKFAPVFIDNQNKEPIRAYVVESDISNAQKRISRIERSTRF